MTTMVMMIMMMVMMMIMMMVMMIMMMMMMTTMTTMMMMMMIMTTKSVEGGCPTDCYREYRLTCSLTHHHHHHHHHRVRHYLLLTPPWNRTSQASWPRYSKGMLEIIVIAIVQIISQPYPSPSSLRYLRHLRHLLLLLLLLLLHHLCPPTITTMLGKTTILPLHRYPNSYFVRT